MSHRIDELARLLETIEAEDAPSASHPDAAADEELAELVSLVSVLRSVGSEERPDPGFRSALRDRLRLEADQLLAEPLEVPARPVTLGWRERLGHWRRSVALAAASATSAFALGSAGIVAAAEHAQPGEALYSMKLTTESVRRSLAADTAAVGRLELAFAERRLEEVVAGAGTLGSDALIDTLAAMDAHTRNGVDLLLDVYAETGRAQLLRDVSTFAARQRQGLVAVTPELPAVVSPFVNASLDVLEEVEARLAAAALGCTDCDAPDPGAAPQVAPPSPTQDPHTDELDTGSVEDPETVDASDEPSPDATPTSAPSLPPAPELPGTEDLTDELPEVDEPGTSPLDPIVEDIIESTDDTLGDLDS